MYKHVVIVGNACLINNVSFGEKPQSFSDGSYESLVLTKGLSLIQALCKILIEGLSNFFS